LISQSGDLSIRGADDTSDASSDLERLEKAVLELASRHAALRGENARLTRDLLESHRRVARLEAELRQGNQLRSDVAKRIDDLVGQIDQIEERFAVRGA
jgi:chromosome segregation ATPase